MSTQVFMHEQIQNLTVHSQTDVSWTVKYWVTALDDPNDTPLGQWARGFEGTVGDPGVPEPADVP